MREILFKARATFDGKWIMGDLLQVRGSLVIHHCVNGRRVSDWVHDKTVCQYAWLTDKNGAKVFEGDNIRFKYWDGRVLERTVCWDENYNRFCVWVDGATNVGVNRYLSDDVEVIGNIHDKEE